MTTLWVIWIWIWLFGAYFWILLFEQQFILDETMTRIYTTWRIIFWTVLDFYSMKLGNWSVNTKKSLVCMHYRFPRCNVDVDKLIVWKGLPDHQRQSVRLLLLCALCGKKMRDDPVSTWKSKIKWYSENIHVKETNRIDGMPTEFEWKIFPGTMALGLLEKIQNLMRDLQCKLEDFTHRIIFMSMYSDIEWRAIGNKERCEYNSQTVADYAWRFPRGHWCFLGPG